MNKRFNIFKRDNFACQYCGRKAPEATLTIDHKIPKSKGGGSGDDNLVTACLECNQGKADVLLTQVMLVTKKPKKKVENKEVLSHHHGGMAIFWPGISAKQKMRAQLDGFNF